MSDNFSGISEENRLFSLLCEGNKEAFDKIYKLYWKKLFVYLVKVIQDKEAAQDIVQEIFVSLWLRRDSIPHSTTLAGYLFTAARFKGISHIQASANKTKHLDNLIKYYSEQRDVVNEEYAAKELNLVLNKEIEKLPPKMREVFVLSRKENLSYKEISEKLNISDKTVKKQINNALKHFKLILNEGSFYQILVLGSYLL
ncbi:RNA polymerase sigma-70 factor [Desertivirga xinjiangensis]|uniref:RNA polymerase sigma-70 factor n=1 Tax=Desertivirga xinjiangensis TaxID=539206 RepID=UPI00210C64B2|nr:RNA polymerase sigma-70 factor [Pedobacter xinjiangensis]